MEKDRIRIGRVRRLVIYWGSASSRGLGRSIAGGEGTVCYESVHVTKERSPSAARAPVKKCKYCFHIFFVLQIRGLVRLLV